MASVDQMKLAPLIRRQRPEDRVVKNSCPSAKAALALVQTRCHLLQFRKRSRSRLLKRKSSRSRTLRGLPSIRQVSKIDHQQNSDAILHRDLSSQRSVRSETFREPRIGPFISKKEVFDDLRRSPLPVRRLRQRAGIRAACCFIEFPAQSFEIGMHDSDSVQSSTKQNRKSLVRATKGEMTRSASKIPILRFKE